MERVALTSKFRFLEVDSNLRLVEQARRHRLFILLAGKAAAVATARGRALQAGDVFGDISLIADSRRRHVVTLEKSFVLQLPRSDFNEVIMTHRRSWSTLPHWLTIAYKHRKLKLL